MFNLIMNLIAFLCVLCVSAGFFYGFIKEFKDRRKIAEESHGEASVYALLVGGVFFLLIAMSGVSETFGKNF